MFGIRQGARPFSSDQLFVLTLHEDAVFQFQQNAGAARERQDFSRSFYTVTWIFDAKQRNWTQKKCIRSHGFSMQNSATGRKRNAFGLTVFVLVKQRFAKACKP